MKVVITIPAYNEQKTIAAVISDIRSVMADMDHEILVVDDGSKDSTAKVARDNGARVVSNMRNMGLAHTFKVEMSECLKMGADVIVHTDADNQYPARYIPDLVKKISEGYDLVLGSRFGKGNYSGSLMKKLGNVAFAKVFSGLLGIRLTDTTTGFRAFTSEVATLPLINTFTYTQEQLIRAGKSKMRIGEVPITTNKTRPSHLFSNPIDYAIKAWVNIFRIYRDFEPLRFFGVIGATFFALGVFLGIYIFYHWLTYGAVGGIPRVILTAILMLTGVQIMLFGFLADMLRK